VVREEILHFAHILPTAGQVEAVMAMVAVGHRVEEYLEDMAAMVPTQAEEEVELVFVCIRLGLVLREE
jgi:hypothetical protein